MPYHLKEIQKFIAAMLVLLLISILVQSCKSRGTRKILAPQLAPNQEKIAEESTGKSEQTSQKPEKPEKPDSIGTITDDLQKAGREASKSLGTCKDGDSICQAANNFGEADPKELQNSLEEGSLLTGLQNETDPFAVDLPCDKRTALPAGPESEAILKALPQEKRKTYCACFPDEKTTCTPPPPASSDAPDPPPTETKPKTWWPSTGLGVALLAFGAYGTYQLKGEIQRLAKGGSNAGSNAGSKWNPANWNSVRGFGREWKSQGRIGKGFTVIKSAALIGAPVALVFGMATMVNKGIESQLTETPAQRQKRAKSLFMVHLAWAECRIAKLNPELRVNSELCAKLKHIFAKVQKKTSLEKN